MVVYYVRWEKGSEPVKSQKGRRKVASAYYDCTFLCRNSKRPLSLADLKQSLSDVSRPTY